MRATSLLLILIVSIVCAKVNAQKTQPEIARYTKVPTGYLMVLRQGDDILKEIELLAQKENIPSANFTGMGFVNMTFGFFDFKKKSTILKSLKIWSLPVCMALLHGNRVKFLYTHTAR